MEKITLNEKVRIERNLKNLMTYLGLVYLAVIGFSLVIITGAIDMYSKEWVGYLILALGSFFSVPGLAITAIVIRKIDKDKFYPSDLKAFKIVAWIMLNRWMLKVYKKIENDIAK